MLINFTSLLEKHNIKPRGILHIGASTGQEFAEYQKNGINKQIWVEAIPSVFEQLKTTIEPNADAAAFMLCISDEDGKEVDFKITGINNGESSSFLDMGTHLELHSNVLVTETKKMVTCTIDSMFENLQKYGFKSRSGQDIHQEDYDFLNMDLQGCEIYALRGMKNFLSNVNYIYTEVNASEVYKGNMLLDDFDKYLSEQGFERIELKWGVDGHWGDALYRRVKTVAINLPQQPPCFQIMFDAGGDEQLFLNIQYKDLEKVADILNLMLNEKGVNSFITRKKKTDA